MLDSAVSFVSIATGGLTRGKTLHEADFAAWHYNYSITINICLYSEKVVTFFANHPSIILRSSFVHPSFILRLEIGEWLLDLRRIIGGECAVGVEAASVGFVDKTNFAPQRYELILKRQRKMCTFLFLVRVREDGDVFFDRAHALS